MYDTDRQCHYAHLAALIVANERAPRCRGASAGGMICGFRSVKHVLNENYDMKSIIISETTGVRLEQVSWMKPQ